MSLPRNPEPVLTAAAAHSAVIAVVGALAVFNVWHPSDVQIEALFGAYLALSPYVAFFLRAKVTPWSPPPRTPVATSGFVSAAGKSIAAPVDVFLPPAPTAAPPA